jgi:hypothetical protein
VLLERRHAAQHPLVNEGRIAPLDRLLDLGARGMHRLAQVRENRLCKISGLRDVVVDACISLAHAERF